MRADAIHADEADLGAQMETAELLGVPHVLILRPLPPGAHAADDNGPPPVRATLCHLRSHKEAADVPVSGAELAKLLKLTAGRQAR